MALRDIAFEQFAFVINSPPQVVGLAVDLHEALVHRLPPVRIGAPAADPLPVDFRSKLRAKSVTLKPSRFVADFDAAFTHQILHFPRESGKRTYNITAR